MAKSLRNKAQNKSRRLKRAESWYAVADADRIQRLSDRLLKRKAEKEEAKAEGIDETMKDDASEADEETAEADEEVKMEEDDEKTPAKKISTSGARLNRREEWRLSKGMSIRGESKGNNRQGIPKARRRSGRPSRRR